MKKTYIKKYILTFIIALIIAMIVLCIGVFAWLKITPAIVSTPANPITVDGQTTDTKPSPSSLFDQKMSIPTKTNFLIVGVDEGEMLTDVMMVGSFDSTTGKISIISIPRDTYTKLSSSMISEMKSDGIKGFPTTMKINAIHSYTGKIAGMKYDKAYIEDMLGIKIQYTALINVSAFREIVDAVGGIQMQIRPQGYHYRDPYQNLTIDVPGGLVNLDGKTAEGVVRFRHDYALGDLDRIDIQHQFMKDFLEQVLNKKTIMDNATEIATTCLKYIKTDFPITDIPKYIPYIKTIDPKKFTMSTLPGDGEMVDVGGQQVSYFMPDSSKTLTLVNRIFYGGAVDLSADTLKDAKIQILNGSKLSGLANKVQANMNTDGYKVASTGNSTDKLNPKTKIYISQDADVSAIQKYFKSSDVIVDGNRTNFYDVVIVLGTDETDTSTNTSASPSPTH